MEFKNHPDYDKYFPRWTRCRDAVAGQDEVHAKGETYLPKPASDWTVDEYAAFLHRALYFNASGRTLDLYTGLVFHTPPVIEAPPGMDNFIEDATQQGQSLEHVARRCVQEVLSVGRVGILVDYPSAPEGVTLTAVEVEALNLRPRLALYKAEAIENWAQEWRLNKYVAVMIQLSEAEDRKRVLILDDSNVYRVQTFRRQEVQGIGMTWVQTGEVVPLMNGRPLDFIPFILADPVDNSLSVDQPPMLDLVNVNISHYQTMADLELGRQKTALPTFYAAGWTRPEIQEGEPTRLGAGNALISTSPDTKFGLLEFTGQGLGALETADKDKREMMARLGARMITDTNAAQSGVAKAIDRAGEDSVLGSLAASVGASLTHAMEIARDWYGFSGPVEIRLNQVYQSAQANPQELVAMIGAVQAGTLSLTTLWTYLQERGIVDRSRTLDQEREAVESDAASLTAGLTLGA